MGSVKLNAGGQCVRFFFIVWNIIVLLIGIAAIGVGSWQVASNNDYDFVTGTRYASGSALLIVGGIVALVIALLGIFGAIMLWRVMLALYAIIVCVFVLLEVAAAVVGFVFRDNVEDQVSDRALEAIQEDYTEEKDAEDFVDYIQDQFDCCGWNNLSDWSNSTYFREHGMYPESCECKNGTSSCVTTDTDQAVWDSGCKDQVIDDIERYQIAVGTVGIIFAVLQFLAVIDAIILCCCVQMRKKEYTTV